jgi:hypothetical protein
VKHVKNNSSSESRKRVEKYVKELSALEVKCRQSHTRDWPFPYLARVYGLYMNWRKKNLSIQRRADLDRFILKRSSRRDKKSLHLIIECTSTANAKARNKWASALLAARNYKIEAKKIPEFLLNKDGGGIAGRVAEYATYRKKLKKKKGGTSGKATRFSGRHKTSPQRTSGNTSRTKLSAVSQKNDNDNDNWK